MKMWKNPIFVVDYIRNNNRITVINFQIPASITQSMGSTVSFSDVILYVLLSQVL